MTSKELAQKAVKLLSGKKAAEIKVLEISDLTVLADYFVIATGTSSTHLKTLSAEIEYGLKQQGVMPNHTEGKGGGSWKLLDYGGVVVHLLLKEAREFYSIERLWSDAKQYGEEDFDEEI
jgi:ribosome-associated protein